MGSRRMEDERGGEARKDEQDGQDGQDDMGVRHRAGKGQDAARVNHDRSAHLGSVGCQLGSSTEEKPLLATSVNWTGSEPSAFITYKLLWSP